jgi:hypothetical protein
MKLQHDTNSNAKKVTLTEVEIANETFYKISDVDSMRPFFMSIVSNSNHWLFVGSNGGISAGRKNANFALFPYYTDDKIIESAETTGSKTIFRVNTNEETFLWEPFSIRNEGEYHITRNLYQNKCCNKIIFEEINHDLQLSFQYKWSSSNLYGFVKQSTLANLAQQTVTVDVLDGLQNILPYGVPADLQTTTSNLADGYKRSELIPESGLGIFALSAIIVDKAEPAEALKANIVWSLGLDNATYLVSALQLNNFRANKLIVQEEDVKGEKGAYFIVSQITLNPQEEKNWLFVANVNQNHSAIIHLSKQIKAKQNLVTEINNDINKCTLHLQQLTGAADSFQYTGDSLKDTRHYSNVLFNIMRGGIFDNNYQIEKWDFKKYLQKANCKVFEKVQSNLSQLAEEFSLFELKDLAKQSNNSDFIRLANEYLPLKFSRRHGDPSRPWNKFSINTQSEVDGSKILDYEGNWRDIFQNWEALAHSYPAFIEGMIAKFLNASTFDGYNPYRVTKDGFDWETIEPDNPWSYIGYWGDHQIIYLLKFLEFAEQQSNGAFAHMISKEDFVYANVPYRIKTYSDIVKNPKDTIAFDDENEKQIHARIKHLGADGALLATSTGEIYKVTFLEKILATALAKLSNFIPEGGIWMNTQRPEWNDANNALVGNGVSMVTLYYLRRFLKFLETSVSNNSSKDIAISIELHLFFNALAKTLVDNLYLLSSSINNKDRKKITDALGTAASDYRNQIYNQGFSGKKENIAISVISSFINNAIQFVEHSIKANKRTDGLYHAYNLLSFEGEELKVSHLSEMLEGQVAVLSSGFLSAAESLHLLDALKQSALYRKDQNSYILYPNKQLPKFLEKNIVPQNSINNSALLQQLLKENNTAIIETDVNGLYHFNGNFMNANDVATALDGLDAKFTSLVQKDKDVVLQIFEEVFNHKEFTGRSGTFFAFEGLGSIYWHMVSKLALAVQETCVWATKQNADEAVKNKLVTHYYAITDGIGVHKSPEIYGAFPITPYSHTPLHKGAQQPGMTGQVKEDILCRIGKLGVYAQDGQLVFNPTLLKSNEFLTESKEVRVVDVEGKEQLIKLKKSALCFTYCGVPIVYVISNNEKIEVEKQDGVTHAHDGLVLDKENTVLVLHRLNVVKKIEVFLHPSRLVN